MQTYSANLLTAGKYAVKSKKERTRAGVLLALAGAVVGAVNGLFGAGGGMLAVPVLTWVAGLPQKKAHATAIALILPLCAIASVVYAFKGGFDASALPATVAGVVAGSVLGALFLKKISVAALDFLFYGLMLFAGLKMML